jgi:hypothetical protein
MSTRVGRYKNYYWLKSESIEQRDVLEKSMNFLVGKYLAVTAFDSGELSLSWEDVEAGWKANDRIAYSPKLTESEIDYIPYFGFDEWYFLESDKLIEAPIVFVNFIEFDISGDDTTRGFWDQIDQVNPYAYIADGIGLTVVTKDKDLLHFLRNLC